MLKGIGMLLGGIAMAALGIFGTIGSIEASQGDGGTVYYGLILVGAITVLRGVVSLIRAAELKSGLTKAGEESLVDRIGNTVKLWHVLLVVIPLAIWAIIHFTAPSGGGGSPKPQPKAISPNVTRENYDRLTGDMTLAEVQEVLGKSHASDPAGQIHTWHSGNVTIEVRLEESRGILPIGGSSGKIVSRTFDEQGGDRETVRSMWYRYREVTGKHPESRKKNPDPQVLAREMRNMGILNQMTMKEILEMLKTGREKGWEPGAPLTE